jgi:hypothetical protein
MDHIRQRRLIESVARTLAEPVIAGSDPHVRDAMMQDIESTFSSMISSVQQVRADLNRLFTNNGVLGESVTPMTLKRLDGTLASLMDDFKDLATRHK